MSGKITSNFQRGRAKESPDGHCFSVSTMKKKTIDLEVECIDFEVEWRVPLRNLRFSNESCFSNSLISWLGDAASRHAPKKNHWWVGLELVT